MHGGFAVGVDGVHVGAELQQQLHGFEHFRFGPGVFVGGRVRQRRCRRGHQRRAVIGVRQQRVGAQLDEQAACKRASAVPAASRNGVAPTLLIRPGPPLPFFNRAFTSAPCCDQFPDELEAAQMFRSRWAAGRHRRRRPVRLADPGDACGAA